MQHRITVLGAGYAGAFGAGYLARHLHADDFAITVVNAEPDFVERLRNHQVAAGQTLKHRPLAKMFAGTGIRLRVARVDSLDPDDRTVTVADDRGRERLEYDTLVYALGSTAADHGLPGVDEHAFHVASRPAALRLRARLETLHGGTVLVVGGNLTAIETATELAESHPELKVVLATRGELGGWLGPKARAHLMRAFDRFGIEVHERTAIGRVAADGAFTAGGEFLAADATVWTAGFAVHPIAAASGLAVQANGQITVDAHMRSVSHPEVYAAGDAVFTIGENGRPLPMSCASAGPTTKRAASAIIHELTGRKIEIPALSYVGNHISLGRRDAIFQLVDRNAQAKSGALCGRTAARIKNDILKGAALGAAHPTFGVPSRRLRRAAAPTASTKAVAA
ncbi:NAD(P)/FAD-dependent oxidoreductase [Glycomyces tritici]|uniref:FAD-dependent oxidoreductase n=1 Tax=Glycomyces tritici TaxID=2665176 RepID=A0ABT7YLQ9_9ACTN|nr:FAD-dependent oxidoreductase [Glycomyces tritici]MDN3239576.1 FAD-dependent oxidoreductase [Glycomyces tritici]